MTPKDIVDQIGNIANRPDLNELKHNMELQIEKYANEKAKQALDDEWKAILQWKPYLHHCYSAWDGLLIDQNDAEFMNCDCYKKKPDGRWQDAERELNAANEASEAGFEL